MKNLKVFVFFVVALPGLFALPERASAVQILTLSDGTNTMTVTGAEVFPGSPLEAGFTGTLGVFLISVNSISRPFPTFSDDDLVLGGGFQAAAAGTLTLQPTGRQRLNFAKMGLFSTVSTPSSPLMAELSMEH